MTTSGRKEVEDFIIASFGHRRQYETNQQAVNRIVEEVHTAAVESSGQVVQIDIFQYLNNCERMEHSLSAARISNM